MPISGMDMNNIVTDEHCEQRVNTVLNELGFSLTEEATWFGWIGWNQGYVLDVTGDSNTARKLLEQREEGRHFPHAHPEYSKPWHEKFVNVNMDDTVKTTTWLSNAPMITERLNDMHRSRQVPPASDVSKRPEWQQSSRV